MSWWDKLKGAAKSFFDWLDPSDIPEWGKIVLQKTWDALYEWLWLPVRDYFQSLAGGIIRLALEVPDLAAAVYSFGQKVGGKIISYGVWAAQYGIQALSVVEDLIAGLPSMVEDIVTSTVLRMIEAILDAVEDFVDAHWEE